MVDQASLASLRAAVDTVMPRTDDLPGAVDLGADQHVAEQMEAYLPGFTDLASLLDAYAAGVRPGVAFVDLERPDREAVIREMVADESQDVREIVDAVFVFTLGGAFSEWSGLDRDTGRLEPPPTWAAVGYLGPSTGHPGYREDA